MTQHAVRRAQPSDAKAIEAFLAQYAPTSMFLRSNLAAHGLGGSAASTATDMIICVAEDRVLGAFGISNSGYLMVQNPGLIAPPMQLRDAWGGRAILGMTGEAAQVAPVLDVLGLQHAPTVLSRDEPLYDLNLSTLAGPFEDLRAPTSADHDMLCAWFVDYLRDTGFSDDADAVKSDAERRATRAIKQTSLRIMEEDGTPVAMTDFNAQVADIVQIGGVFVPQSKRNKGYGRRVVAAHLAQARVDGINRAILFAANEAAARAYEAIGFRQIGHYRVVLFEKGVLIPDARANQGDL